MNTLFDTLDLFGVTFVVHDALMEVSIANVAEDARKHSEIVHFFFGYLWKRLKIRMLKKSVTMKFGFRIGGESSLVTYQLCLPVETKARLHRLTILLVQFSLEKACSKAIPSSQTKGSFVLLECGQTQTLRPGESSLSS